MNHSCKQICDCPELFDKYVKFIQDSARDDLIFSPDTPNDEVNFESVSPVFPPLEAFIGTQSTETVRPISQIVT